MYMFLISNHVLGYVSVHDVIVHAHAPFQLYQCCIPHAPFPALSHIDKLVMGLHVYMYIY